MIDVGAYFYIHTNEMLKKVVEGLDHDLTLHIST